MLSKFSKIGGALFTKEEAEAQRDEGTCLGAQGE